MQIVHVSCGSLDEAHQIAEIVVGERLAASANIISQAQSIFWWNGEVISDSEVIIIFKTRAVLFDKLSARIKAMHSYECPSIVGVSITNAHPVYAEWLKRETNAQAQTVIAAGQPRTDAQAS